MGVPPITFVDIEAGFSGRFILCWCCVAVMKHMRRVGNFYMIEHMFENVILGWSEASSEASDLCCEKGANSKIVFHPCAAETVSRIAWDAL